MATTSRPAAGFGGIVTPEAVLLEFQTAGVPSRAIASLLDFLIVAAGGLMVLTFVGTVGITATGAVIVLLLTAFSALFIYPILCEVLFDGRSVGKRIMGLRVVTVEGAPVRFRHAAVRSALGIVDFLIPPIGVAAILSVLLGRTDQRLGDRLAGTVVVRNRSGARDARAFWFPPLPGLEGYAASLDVSSVYGAAYEILRSFLTRAPELTYDARAALAINLANSVAIGMRHSPPPGIGPEAFLASVAAAYQIRHGGPLPPPPVGAPPGQYAPTSPPPPPPPLYPPPGATWDAPPS